LLARMRRRRFLRIKILPCFIGIECKIEKEYPTGNLKNTYKMRGNGAEKEENQNYHGQVAN